MHRATPRSDHPSASANHYLLQDKKLNFDFAHELDEYMAPSELLTHQKRKHRDVTKLSKEMRQLEEECVCI